MPPSMPPPPAETIVADEQEPSRTAWWASCLLGLGLLLIGSAHFLQGDYQRATEEFAGAFGTLGLPALAGRGYHLEIRRGTVAPPGRYSGMPRLSESNLDMDVPDLPGRRPGGGS